MAAKEKSGRDWTVLVIILYVNYWNILFVYLLN